MKTRTFVSTLAVCFVAAMCFAAGADMMGTCKLNEAKSKIGPGRPRTAPSSTRLRVTT